MNQNETFDRTALAEAIELEKTGHKYFKDCAAKAKNVLAREVFNYLADEELNHLRAIENFNEKYLNGLSADTDSLIRDIRSHKSPIDQIFDRVAKATPIDGGELDVYRFAEDFEIKSEKFYARAEAETADPSAKKLYAFLIGEERKHFKIVESCLAYFENPAEFFHQREKWHLEA